MRNPLVYLLVASLCAVNACGGDDSTGPDSPSHESIAGSYAGTMTGVSQGVALDGNFSITLTQSTGALSGSYSLSGTLNDGVDLVPFQGTGALTGAIEAGDNPSVNLTATPGGCPNYHADFSGAYDSDNRRITLTGPVEFFSDGCEVALSYSMTLILNR